MVVIASVFHLVISLKFLGTMTSQTLMYFAHQVKKLTLT